MNRILAGVTISLFAGLGVGGCVAVSGPLPPSEPVVAKSAPAYMLVLGEVHDREAFMEGYASKLGPLYDKYGGSYIAVAGGASVEVLEGDYSPSSIVLGKWESMEAARAFWNSPEYAPLKAARIDNDWGDFDVILVQGLPLAE